MNFDANMLFDSIVSTLLEKGVVKGYARMIANSVIASYLNAAMYSEDGRAYVQAEYNKFVDGGVE